MPIGLAHERAARPDLAIAAYERYVRTPWYNRLFDVLDDSILGDPYYLGLALERLGALHEARGDRESAAHYYGRLVTLWEGADAALRPRVAEARRALARLRGPG